MLCCRRLLAEEDDAGGPGPLSQAAGDEGQELYTAGAVEAEGFKGKFNQYLIRKVRIADLTSDRIMQLPDTLPQCIASGKIQVVDVSCASPGCMLAGLSILPCDLTQHHYALCAPFQLVLTLACSSRQDCVLSHAWRCVLRPAMCVLAGWHVP